MDTTYHFMADFTLPDVLSEEFINLIPYQRAKINKLFKEGKLVNYALSLENCKLWAIFKAESEMDVMEMIMDLPLSDFMHVHVNMLTFYNTHSKRVPAFSMN